jgi:predicted transcriptional regulator
MVSFLCFSIATYAQKTTLNFCGNASNDLYVLLKKENIQLIRFDTPEAAVDKASEGSGVLIVSDTYPAIPEHIKPEVL